MSTPDVRPGQIWADNDYRAKGRTLEVVAVVVHLARKGEDYASCIVRSDHRWVSKPTVGRRVRILLRRFRPNSTGYRLVSEPGASDE